MGCVFGMCSSICVRRLEGKRVRGLEVSWMARRLEDRWLEG